ncbi:MAG: hypothetical protein GY700_14955, partial [Propionibacteriaceae bacterium]|nr:hypothetical protein [Propionibacteriaceae bacterium]
TTFFYYDVNAWIDRAEPPQAVGLTRETHVRDLGQGLSTEVQAGVTCSDGFGREIQSKIMVEAGQAWVKELIAPGEPGYVEGEDNYRFVKQNVTERWLSSGRTVFNNKEKPVKQYEPFYTATEAYEPEQFFATHGVTSLIHYDPLLRVVRTDTPKGFHSKVEFDPWTVTSYDTNDTVTDSDYYTENYDLSGFDADEKAALTKAAAHADTPGIAKLDTLGRTFRSVVQLFEEGLSGPQLVQLETQTTFDITGNPLTVRDPRQVDEGAGGVDTFVYSYDMAGRAIRTVNIDAGDDCVFVNAVGNPVLSTDKNGHTIEADYDALHRPVKKTVTGGPGSLNNVVEILEYGEGVAGDQSKNLRGQLYRQYDQSGMVTVPEYDIKGQPKSSEKRIRTEYKSEANWPSTEAERLQLLDAEL